ncbi:hypothetical protein [Thermoflavimicrobium daqui]|uniref:Spore germination protein N-terminal domain-containing protein n=1 Tax=Thermoflavimicrobium daqui TaxID=2137476 RepID=A0A364K5M5_9BACL|nr:hypothetical protein [Thermoflavimicrobium daqui]RAL25587.1 hypothetical protein DL897_05775 [Thermoflavimicrobium daqui]
MRQKCLWVSCILFVFSLSIVGCWDYKDIEDYRFTLGEAFDLKEDTDIDQTREEPQIIFTYQEVIPKLIAQQSSEQLPYQNASFTGRSIYEVAINQVQKQTLPPKTEHIKVIIFGEKLASTMNLFQLFDNYSS